MNLTINSHISSKQNNGIKNLVLLGKQKERNLQDLIVIEGLKEIEKADLSGYLLNTIYFCPEIIDEKKVSMLLKNGKPERIFTVSEEVYRKIAYRENTGGLIALAKGKKHTLENLKLPENPLILVIEGIEKPGNIGAIYRTADAAGIDAIIITDPKTDFYNPNSIRASLGCIFTVPTAISTSKEALSFLKESRINIFSTSLKAAVNYSTADFTKASAIVLGTEDIGISEIWTENSFRNIIIPMRGKADSMNVSTAAAVIIFEACRQRGF